MASQQTLDVLERTRDFHRQLGDFYAREEDHAGKEKVRMLLAYLARHERNLERAIEHYESSGSRRVTGAWFKFASEKATCGCFDNLAVRPDMSLQDIVQMAIKLDNCLVDYFREVAGKTNSTEVRDILQNLLNMEKSEEVRLLRTAVELEQD